MRKDLSYSFLIKEVVHKLEDQGKDFLGIIGYFLIIIFLKANLTLLFEEGLILPFKNPYVYFTFIIYFTFLYAFLLTFLLFLTKLLINRRTDKIVSFLTFTFTLFLLSPLFDLISNERIYTLSLGTKIEVFLAGMIGFFYARVNSRKFYKWFSFPFLYVLTFIFIIFLPYFISKGSSEFWKGSLILYESQKLALIYGFGFIVILFLFFLFFKEYKRGVLREFINYDFLFFNLFLPFMGFWTGYRLLFEEYEIFFDVIFNRFVPFLILIPPFFYSLTKFFYRTKKGYFYFPLIVSLLFSYLLSFIHLLLLSFIYIIYFLNRIFIKTRKVRPLENSIEATILFIFGYSIFKRNEFFYIIAPELLLFILIFFFFYGFARYFLMKRRKTYGFILFVLGLLFLPFLGFVNIFYYSLLILTLIFAAFFYFIGAPSIKTVDLISYFFITLFFILYFLLLTS